MRWRAAALLAVVLCGCPESYIHLPEEEPPCPVPVVTAYEQEPGKVECLLIGNGGWIVQGN